MKRHALLLVVVLVLAPLTAEAATIQDLFQDANARYWKGDIDGAQGLYHRIVEDYRVDNAEVYYNLANTYMKQDRLGSAVLYYKRALRCAPSPETEEAVEANLERARTTLVTRHQQRIEQNRMLFDESHGVWYAVFHLLSSSALAILLLAFYVGLALALLGRRLTQRVIARRILKPIIVTLLGLSLVSGGLLAGHVATTREAVLGIVIRPDVKLRASRLPDAPTVTLPEGLEVRILGAPEEDALRVQLSNGREGYVPVDTVKQI